jgi:hypothetical protein
VHPGGMPDRLERGGVTCGLGALWHPAGVLSREYEPPEVCQPSGLNPVSQSRSLDLQTGSNSRLQIRVYPDNPAGSCGCGPARPGDRAYKALRDPGHRTDVGRVPQPGARPPSCKAGLFGQALSCGAAADRSPQRELWVNDANAASSGGATETLCRSSGACPACRPKPRAHARGYDLPHLRCLEPFHQWRSVSGRPSWSAPARRRFGEATETGVASPKRCPATALQGAFHFPARSTR